MFSEIKSLENLDQCLQNPCAVKPCAHGSCVSHQDGSSYNCICQDGWGGPNCDQVVDHCATVNCRNNGTCKNIQNDFSCICQAGYSGRYCENFDNNHCIVGGNPVDCGQGYCVNDPNGYHCSCNALYTGDKCQQRIDYCTVSP